MTGAQRVAVVAGLIGLAMLYVAVLLGGLVPPTAIAASGLALFGLGVVTAKPGSVVTGAGALVFGAALAIGTDGTDDTDLLLLVSIGVVAPVLVVVADASWWLRRDPEVDPQVARRIVGSMAPALAVGGLMAAGLLVAISGATGPAWLVPVAVIVLGGGFVVTGEIVRDRRPRLGGRAERR